MLTNERSDTAFGDAKMFHRSNDDDDVIRPDAVPSGRPLRAVGDVINHGWVTWSSGAAINNRIETIYKKSARQRHANR